MRLLIITQKVDKNDPILGFFHRWIEEFAKYCQSIIVICLQKGEYDLSKNIKILSLGKEKGKSKIKYIFNFYKHIWHERKNYDAVFVHMNQEYVLLGWKFWKLWNKKIFLWRNHIKGHFITRLSVFFSNKVFCTSPQSFTARFKKTKIMPAGIDIDFFKPDFSVQRNPNSILFLGRIDPVKNVDIFVESLKKLRDEGVKFSATIGGEASDKFAEYEKIIRDKVSEYHLSDKIIFTGAVSKSEALKLYREHEFYVNATPSGSFDKTILEAMACETLPIVSNKSFIGILQKKLIFTENNPKELAEKIKRIMRLGEQEKKNIAVKLRNIVVENHSIRILTRAIFNDDNI